MDWKTRVNVADTVKFITSNGRVYADHARPLTVTSPPFVTTFPKLTKAEIEKSQDRGIRVANYEVDISMKGAKEVQENFKAFMDDLDELLLAHVVSTDTTGTIGRAQAQFMLKPLFKTRRSMKTARDYPDAMNCRSKININDVERYTVLDEKNVPYTKDVVQGDIIRVQLTYRGPYVIRNSCFGNSWELAAVQYCGHHEEGPPSFYPVDPSEFPSLS